MAAILVGSARVAILPDMQGFLAETQAKLKTELAALDTSVPIKFDIDQASLARARAALGPLAAGKSVPLRFNIDAASAARARAALGPLGGERVPIKFDVDQPSLARAEAQFRAATGLLRNGAIPLNVDLNQASLARAQAAFRSITGMTRGSTIPLDVELNQASVARAETQFRAITRALPNGTIPLNLDISPASVARVTAADAATKALAGDTSKAGAAANSANRYFGGWFSILRSLSRTHIPLFGGALGTSGLIGMVSGFHLLADAILEITAVVVPASIALGAFGVAAAPTVQAIYERMKNLYTVSQAFNRQIPGLSGGFEKLADSVKPQVYSVFGDALDILSHKGNAFGSMVTGAGTVIDKLAARFTLAATSGARFGQFLSHADDDLAKLGDIVGNVGGAFANVFKVMPGYAEILLGLADAGSKMLEWATRVAQPVIGFGLAAHGAILYTGLLATGLIKLGTTVVPKVGLAAINAGSKLGVLGDGAIGAASKLGATDHQLANIASNLGGVIGPNGFAKVGADAEEAAGKTGIFSKALGVLEKVPVWGWVAVGAAALGGLVYWLATSKDATQKWIDSLQANITGQKTFTGVTSATATAIEQMNERLNDTPEYYTRATATFSRFGTNLGAVNQRYSELSAGLAKTRAEQDLEQSRLGQLTQVFGSTGNALGIFNKLGIKASDIATATASGWAQDVQAAKGYLTAVTELAGFQGGRALAAQKALTLAQSDQLGAIQQITQAEDAFTNRMIGGEQAFYGFIQNLRQAQSDASKTGASLSGLSKNSIALGNDFYSQLIPAGQKQIDTLNAQFISQGKLRTVTATLAKEMLPLAKGNEAARVAILGLINNALGPGTVSLRDMNKWVGQNSTSLRGYKSIVDQAEGSASSLAKALQTQLNVQFHQALLATSGADGAIKTYTADLEHNRQNTAQGHADRKTLISDLENAGLSAKQATAYVDSMNRALGKIPHHEYIAVDMSGKGHYSIQQGQAFFQGSSAGHGVVGPNKAAAGAYISTGTTSTADDVFARVSKGELIVPTKMVSAGLVDHLRGSIPGFAGGGLITQGNQSVLNGQYATNMVSTFNNDMLKSLTSDMKNAITNAASAARAFGNFGVGVAASGPLQAYAKKLLAAYGWSNQWPAFDAVVNRESGWNPNAQNPSSTAYGIGQFLNTTWGSVGGTKTSNPYLQLQYMMRYIKQAYPAGPDAAWNSEMTRGYYDGGGVLPPGLTLAANLTGQNEFVLRQDQLASIAHGGGSHVTNYNANVTRANPSDIQAAFQAMEMQASRKYRIGRNQ